MNEKDLRKRVVDSMKDFLRNKMYERIDWGARHNWDDQIIKPNELVQEEKLELIDLARDFHKSHRQARLYDVVYFAREILHMQYPELKQDIVDGSRESLKTRGYISGFYGGCAFKENSFDYMLKMISDSERDLTESFQKRLLKDEVSQKDISEMVNCALGTFQKTKPEEFRPYGRWQVFSDEQRTRIKDAEVKVFMDVFQKYLK